MVVFLIMFGAVLLRNSFTEEPGKAWEGAFVLTSPIFEGLGWTVNNAVTVIRLGYRATKNVARLWANLERCHHVEPCTCMVEKEAQISNLLEHYHKDTHDLKEDLAISRRRIEDNDRSISNFREQLAEAKQNSESHLWLDKDSPLSNGFPLLSLGNKSTPEQVHRRIQRLEMENEDLEKKLRIRERNIESLHSELSYLKSEGSFTVAREELSNAKRQMKLQENYIQEINVITMRLRQELEFEKSNHSIACQDEATCSRKIRELEDQNAVLMKKHEENDLMVQNAAREFGKPDSEAKHYTLRQYLQEVTQAMVQQIAVGGLLKDRPVLNTILRQMDQKRIQEVTEYKNKLEFEVDRLGGDVKSMRMGIDQLKPPPARDLTYESYAKTVFKSYQDLFRKIHYLTILLESEKIAPPEWKPEPPQNDFINKPEFEAQNSKSRMLQPYPSRRFTTWEALLQSLINTEIGRLVNRALELRTFILKELPAQDSVFYKNKVEAPLHDTRVIVRLAVQGVLDDIRDLQKRESSIEDTALTSIEERRFRIWLAMHEAIRSLSAAILSFNTKVPDWKKNPNFVAPPFTEKKTFHHLTTNLVKFEINDLEYRIDELLRFMKHAKLPGTDAGQPRLLGPPAYQENFDALRAAVIYAGLVKDHWQDENFPHRKGKLRLPLDHPPLLHALRRVKGPLLVPQVSNFPWKLAKDGALTTVSIIDSTTPSDPHTLRKKIIHHDNASFMNYSLPGSSNVEAPIEDANGLIFKDHDTELKWYTEHHQRFAQLVEFVKGSGKRYERGLPLVWPLRPMGGVVSEEMMRAKKRYLFEEIRRLEEWMGSNKVAIPAWPRAGGPMVPPTGLVTIPI
ncbi:hypothetical protein B0J14DRAFT_580605 [Halenospora varia]|nr:hypothetical protein B0J14DRAFT_580605 [Halenospora varia]